MSKFQPSIITKKRSVAGSERTVGGSIIMPIDARLTDVPCRPKPDRKNESATMNFVKLVTMIRRRQEFDDDLLRLFRQPEIGDWPAVFAEMADACARLGGGGECRIEARLTICARRRRSELNESAEQMPLHSKNRANVDVAHGPIAQLELILDMSQVAEHDLLCSFSVMSLDGRDERLVFVTHAESRLGGPEEADDQ